MANLFTTFLALFHCSNLRNSRFIKWLLGDEDDPRPQAAPAKVHGTNIWMLTTAQSSAHVHRTSR